MEKKTLAVSPPTCKGMTSLDKSCFDKEIEVPVIVLEGNNVYNEHPKLKPYFLKRIGFHPFQKIQQENITKAYLNPALVSVELEQFLENLKSESKDPSVFKSIQLETVRFTFDNWRYDELLDSVLPDDGHDTVRGFSRIGHLIHLNLKDSLLPYKSIIGEILLEKIPNVKTVLNKVNIIDNTYRNFQMEILAGESDTVVQVKQSNCVFHFDFAKVYWNSRLSTEHERIYKRLQALDTLYDVFAGVGPFSIPAGKKRIRVLANDLNPESFKWLQHNIKKNKVDSYVKAFNHDGRDFITNVIKKDLEEQIDLDDIQNRTCHITMNLPAMAVEFLSAFWNLLEEKTIKNSNLKVLVHLYCFVKGEKVMKEEAVSLVKEKLDFDLSSSHLDEVVFVRTVGPNKDMFRVSFYLPHEILTRKHLKRKFSEISNEPSTVSALS